MQPCLMVEHGANLLGLGGGWYPRTGGCAAALPGELGRDTSWDKSVLGRRGEMETEKVF